MTQVEIKIASVLLWQISWPRAVRNIRRKPINSSVVNPLKSMSTKCPSYMRRIECSCMTFLQTRQIYGTQLVLESNLVTMRQTVKRTCLGMICQYLPRLCCSLSRYRECTEIHILKHKSCSTMRQPLVGLLTCFYP